MASMIEGEKTLVTGGAGSLFSIAMPAYNASATIAQAIGSVLAQTISDWELVVVDDGSTDATASIVASYAERDPRIRLVRQDNAGTATARNTGWQHARGAFIVRFDADDILLPSYLEEFDRFIGEHPGRQIYACNAWRVRDDGSRVLFHRSPRFSRVVELTIEDMLQESQIFTAAVSPREFLEAEGGYRRGVFVEEYDFWLRAMARGARHLYNPEPLVLYRESASQMTADVIRVYESQIWVLRDAAESGLLVPEQIVVARRSIQLLEQNLCFRHTAARVLGPKGAERAVRIARKAAWITRPYRWRKK